MSYHVDITRADHTSEAEKHPIVESEWVAVSAKDSSLRLDTTKYYGRRRPSGEEEILYPWMWSAHPDVEEINQDANPP